MKSKVRLGPVVAPGVRAIARQRGEDIEIGMVSKLLDGQPIPEGAEVLHVEAPDCDCGGWQDAETIYGGTGPAQVATPAYREGYDRIFSTKREVGLA